MTYIVVVNKFVEVENLYFSKEIEGCITIVVDVMLNQCRISLCAFNISKTPKS